MKKFFKFYAKVFLFIAPIYLILLLSLLIRVDAYVYTPGNLTDIKSEIKIDGYKKKLNGSVSSIYIMEIARPNLFTLALSSINKANDIYWVTKSSMESYDKDLDYATGVFSSKQSFNNASLAAFEALGENINYRQLTYIQRADKDIISNIKYTSIVGCYIKECGGIEYPILKEVSSYLSSTDNATLKIVNSNGKEETLTLTRKEEGLFGITISTSFILLDDELVKVQNVYTTGGSGGAMQALYIYCLMSDEDLLKGRKIAGTGTISFELDNEGNLNTFGRVGGIGCVKQKLYAAFIDHADIFYCPDYNYNECMNAYKLYGFTEEDIRVVKVSYLSDIIADLRGDTNE